MVIKKEVHVVPDTDFVYDMMMPGRKGAEYRRLFLGGEIPLGIPIGRADKPAQRKFGVSLGSRIGVDLLDERQEPRLLTVVSKTDGKTTVIDLRKTPGRETAPDEKELPVAAKQAAQVRPAGFESRRLALVACNY